MPPSTHSDAMIERLEREVEERSAYIEGAIGNAQDQDRDLTTAEIENTKAARERIKACETQLNDLYESRSRMTAARKRATEVHREFDRLRDQVDNGPVEYRSTGAYLVDYIAGSNGSRDAMERLELYTRAAAHQKTTDNLGVVPDPIVGNVINFIDASRPLVNFLGPQNLPSATWYRPKVTQRTTVAAQGSAGAAADEKSELVSQKMIITRLTGAAVTYGGYVNVSRQDIDFAQPSMLDVVVNDLASQYAIQTEAALGTLVQAQANNVELTGAGAAALVATSFDGSALDGSRERVRRDQGCRAGRAGRAPRAARELGAAVRAGQPPERPVGRVQRRRLRVGGRGEHLGDPGDLLAELPGGGEPLRRGRVDRRHRGVRTAGRGPAGDGAERARCPGRLRRVLHAHVDRDRRRAAHRQPVLSLTGPGEAKRNLPRPRREERRHTDVHL